MGGWSGKEPENEAGLLENCPRVIDTVVVETLNDQKQKHLANRSCQSLVSTR